MDDAPFNPGNGAAPGGPAENGAHANPVPRLRWHNSLYFRVVLLCGVLLLCLLGSVMVITRYYFGEVVERMESDAQQAAQQILIHFEEFPGLDPTSPGAPLPDLLETFDQIRLEPLADDLDRNVVSAERQPDGRLLWVARVPLQIGERRVQMIASVSVMPQTEILRAFRNTYLLALFAVFVVTLGLMVYFIAKALRPLRELTESCSAISAGELKKVRTRRAAGEVLALETTFNEMVESLAEKATVEAKLRQAQRISALGNLAAGVAHDVRNPLNAIKLLSGHALDQLAGNGPEPPPSAQVDAAARQLRTIRDEVGRLEEIVGNFLSLAKDRELRPEPHKVDALLQECVDLVERDAAAREMRLAAELRCGDLELPLDPKAFMRAVLNVLINALEACPPGGRVRLFSRRTESGCEIEIRDDGPGMPREAVERVFEPYYTTKATGTGLGLSITRGIIEEHGGAITLTSAPEQGCQALITLPAKRESPV